MTEESNQLPFQWIQATLGDIASLRKESVDPKEKPDEEFNYLSIGNIESETGKLVDFRRTLGKNIDSAKLAFTKDDILYSRLRPYLNKVFLPDFGGISATDLLPIRPREGIQRKYLGYFLRTRRVVVYANQRLRGIQLPRLPTRDLLALPIPIAPSNEQRRIVAKVEALFAESKTAREALDKVPVLLRRFRQSILTKAFKGELTQRDSSDKPAEELLKNIKQERRKRRQASSVENQRALPEGMPNLPEAWIWTTIGDVFEIASGGTPRRNKPEYWRDGDIPWVSSGEVAFSDITHTREHITKEGLENSSAKLYPPGTVLLALYGEGKTRGQVAILRIPATTNQAVACILCSETSMPSEYLYWWLYHRYLETRRIGEGANQPNMYLHHVRAMSFPLAPISEQRRIAARIKELFSIADDVETNVEKARRKTDSVDQAVLVKAFRGELVPQDSRDEPASTLIERIRATYGLNKSSHGKLSD